jgi:YidC/Oxa1 family membrane protein insertase
MPAKYHASHRSPLIMNIGHIFSLILVYPLLNLLIFFYHYIPDIGVVIILLTVIVRIILLPVFQKQLKSQKAMTELQPKLNELKEKYKGDKEAESRAMLEFYKTHKINPLASCLPLLIQLPILISLSLVFIRSLNGSNLAGLYKFIPKPTNGINPYFLHFINLAHSNIWLLLIAGASQYLLSRLMLPKNPSSDPTVKMMTYQTLYFLPVLTIILGLRFPAGVVLYWIITTLFGIVQQYYLLSKEKEVIKEVIDASK